LKTFLAIIDVRNFYLQFMNNTKRRLFCHFVYF